MIVIQQHKSYNSTNHQGCFIKMSVWKSYVHFVFIYSVTAFSLNEDKINWNNYEVVYPKVHTYYNGKRGQTVYSGETNFMNQHEKKDVAVEINAFGRDHVIKLKTNLISAAPQVKVRYFQDDGKEAIKMVNPSECHYQGKIVGSDLSMAALSMCEGIRGYIDDGSSRIYIEPHSHKENGAHKVYQIVQKPSGEDRKCGRLSKNFWNIKNATKHQERKSLNRKRREVDEFYSKYLVVGETRYVELVLVADNALYKNFGSSVEKTTKHLVTLSNAVDTIYSRINVRVVLVGVEIWSKNDKVPRKSTLSEPLLKDFEIYRRDVLRAKFKGHDNAQLLCKEGWDDAAGLAQLWVMCKDTSSSIVAWNHESIVGPWIASAHEMGHNMGMEHDEEIGHCTCLTPRGCIMGGHKTRIAGFSDCSLEALQKLDDFCLYNIPSMELEPKCGNGIVEEGEECDCGNEQNCKEKDFCCESKGCKLKKGSQCSDFNHSCCKQCLFKPKGETCRHPKGECDVAEYCSGTSGKCPEDDYRRDGDSCNSEKQIIQGVLYYGQTYKHVFSPAVTSRYIRINPTHWNDKKCLTVELYGCDSKQVAPDDKTPLSMGKFCIAVSGGGCRPRDGSNLILSLNSDCEKPEMEFTLSSDGVLRHACSNAPVCSQMSRDGLLVVSRKCSNSDARFERTAGGSLRHTTTGQCIHPQNGAQQEGTKLLLYPECDQKRLKIDFMKQDCLLPLGMASGKIKDEQISASSYVSKHEPKFARLGTDNNAWCGMGSKDQYLQIDLSKTTTITGILLSGLEWNYVQGYFVYYSQDGQRWTAFTEKSDISGFNSYCYMGKCAETRSTQCANLWGPGGKSADKPCWDKYNKQRGKYGTCNPSRPQPCKSQDILCGQLQCLDMTTEKPNADYGTDYQRVTISGNVQCSVASLKKSDFVGLGMVQDGTKCASNKICRNYKCQKISKKSCPKVNGKECAGNGVCSQQGKCACDEGFDPSSSCSQAFSPINGKWGTWSSWTDCSRLCNGGTRERFRYCDNPSPENSGKSCPGNRIEVEDCNSEQCPEAHSCRHLQEIGKEKGQTYKDGFYAINPDGKGPVMTYCDMSRDGGGWTLLITSYTNSWTSSTVKKMNEQNPSLKEDFSILFKADEIKNCVDVTGDYFEYRLEANKFGHWGGIWKAPRSYSFLATDNKQTDVQLETKFDDWKYDYLGIDKRMPYLYNERLTLSPDPKNYIYGSITANIKEYHPAPWIYGKKKETQPAYIWYWMREGVFNQPSSCMDILTRSLSGERSQDGIYTLKIGDELVKTYCDMSRNGGAWTLLMSISTQRGWTGANIKRRNENKPKLNSDFSVLGISDSIIGKKAFQYRIEADGDDSWGGIWEASKDYSLASTSDSQTRIKLLQKFGDWEEIDSNLNKRIPYISKNGLYTTRGSDTAKDGTLIGNGGNVEYIKNVKPRPRFIRLWVREGTSRSCFEIKARGERHEAKFPDGIYMIHLKQIQNYLPVYCDMTSESGAYTLLVTSANGNWRVEDVKKRNIDKPSLTNDYSILGEADNIKDASGSIKFRYKLDANQRDSWGGIWEAPIEYSFVKLDNSQNKVKLIKRFGNWKTSRDTIQNRLPYLGSSKSLLTTNEHSVEWYAPGTIITDNNDLKPANWIYPNMYSPGIIWYWLNDDDCEASRKPVHGGLSGWSAWSPCDQLCRPGKQRRQMLCNNPKPRCGGDPCDLGQTGEESRDCNVCTESPIKSSNALCVEPRSSGCRFRDDTDLVYSNGPSDCSNKNQAFAFGENGLLMHKCSGKYVCPKGQGNTPNGAKLVLSSRCSEDQATFIRTRRKSLKHKASGLCVHPQGGSAQRSKTLVLWDTCDEQRLVHDLFQLP